MESLSEALCRIAKTTYPLRHKLDLMREEAVANQEFDLAAFFRECMICMPPEGEAYRPTGKGK